MARTWRFVPLVALVAMPLVARAQLPRLESARPPARQLAEDVADVTAIAQHNLALAALGKVAIDHSKEARIRQLGTVVNDNANEANQAIGKLAARMQIELPDNMSPTASADVTALRKRTPDASFDRALLDKMLDEERQTLALVDDVQGRARSDDAKKLLEEAGRSLREAERATAIERKPLESD